MLLLLLFLLFLLGVTDFLAGFPTPATPAALSLLLLDYASLP